MSYANATSSEKLSAIGTFLLREVAPMACGIFMVLLVFVFLGYLISHIFGNPWSHFALWNGSSASYG